MSMHRVIFRYCRHTPVVAALAAAYVTSAPQAHHLPQSSLLDVARRAVGVDRTAVKTLVVKGWSRRSFNVVTAEFGNMAGPTEYRFHPPDRLLRIAALAISPGLTEERRGTRDGEIVAAGPGNEAVARGTLVEIRRIGLGLVLWTDELSLTVHPVAGQAHGIEVRGPDGSRGVIDFDPATSLPARFRYEGGYSLPEGPPVPVEQRRPGVQVPMTRERGEITLSFEDHRLVDGLRLPHRIRWTARGITIRELRVDEILVNPPLGRDDFR
jgi:hypothetical protein